MQIGNPYQETDPRTPLDKLRRVQLIKIMEANNLKYDPSKTPATSMRRSIEENGVDYTNFDFSRPIVKASNQASALSETAAQMEARIRAEIMAETNKPVDLSSETRATLMKTCKEKGIKVTIHDKKKDLLEKLNGNIT